MYQTLQTKVIFTRYYTNGTINKILKEMDTIHAALNVYHDANGYLMPSNSKEDYEVAIEMLSSIQQAYPHL
jgi:hypothetical protein